MTDEKKSRHKVVRLSTKMGHIDSDLHFLKLCRDHGKIPRGLRIGNPLKNTLNSNYAEELCQRTARLLMKHLTHQLYKKRGTLSNYIRSIYENHQNISNELQNLADQTRAKRRALDIKKKNQKLKKLGIQLERTNTPNHVAVINLSHYTPNSAELQVLERGLKFCPTKPMDGIDLAADTEEFIRRLRLREYFLEDQVPRDNSVSRSTTENEFSTNKNSLFTPPEGRSQKLDLYAQSLRKFVNAQFMCRQRRTVHNLTTVQRRAIKTLKSNDDIIIKPADKGGAVVIMDREEYHKEALRQLSDNNLYEKLQEDPTKTHTRELNQLIRSFPYHLKNKITKLVPEDSKPGVFYLLPKIHKQNHPGRPIVSGRGTLCEDISGYVEGILKPLVQETPSFVRDTTDFLDKLSKHGKVPDKSILATMDVSSLYSNIPHEAGITATRRVLEKNGCPFPETTLKLIKFILEHNSFVFDNTYYLQKQGTAMGTRFAPQYANLFMHRLEEDLFASRPLRPDLYLRYIDDIFLIWSHGKESLVQLHEDINKIFPTINLTMEFSEESITFLDTRVYLREGNLQTSLHRKPTDNSRLLHATSSHPHHVKDAIPYGQALRIHRICSNPEDRKKHLGELEQKLLQSGYRRKAIRKQFNRATTHDREELLIRRQKESTDRVPFVTTYFPGAEQLRKGIRKLQHLLEDDLRLSQALPKPPVLAFRQPPNLRKALVKSKFSTGRETANVQPCNHARCLTCPTINTETTVTRGQATNHVRGQLTCHSRGVVYLIRCRKCPEAWYIGETGQKLRRRMNGHRATIRNQSPLPVGEHFDLPQHSPSDMLVNILRGDLHDPRQRKVVETKLTHRFDTIRNGLNRDKGFMAHYELAHPQTQDSHAHPC